MLHLVTASPHRSSALADALAAWGAADELVLMHAAVAAAPAAAALAPAVLAGLAGRRVFALAADLAARGIAPGALRAGIAPLDDAGLVRLALAHPQSLTWS